MQKDIGIAMSDRMLVVGDVNASQPQRPSGCQSVRVFSKSDT